jgi:ribosomal protein L29
MIGPVDLKAGQLSIGLREESASEAAQDSLNMRAHILAHIRLMIHFCGFLERNPAKWEPVRRKIAR